MQDIPGDIYYLAFQRSCISKEIKPQKNSGDISPGIVEKSCVGRNFTNKFV